MVSDEKVGLAAVCGGRFADEEAGLPAVSDCAKEGGLAATRGAAPKNPVERKINQNVDITNG